MRANPLSEAVGPDPDGAAHAHHARGRRNRLHRRNQVADIRSAKAGPCLSDVEKSGELLGVNGHLALHCELTQKRKKPAR